MQDMARTSRCAEATGPNSCAVTRRDPRRATHGTRAKVNDGTVQTFSGNFRRFPASPEGFRPFPEGLGVLLAAERPVRPLVMALLFGRLMEAHCLRYRELATHSVAMATGKAEPRVLHGSGCLTRGRLSSEEVSGQGARSLVVFLLKPAASAPLPSSTRSTVQEHPSNRPHPLCTPVCVSASVSSPLAQHEE